MSETTIKLAVMRSLKRLYPRVVVIKFADRFTSGIPDLLVIYEGKHVFIELKTPVGIISSIQKYMINKINSAGGMAVVCRSVDDVINVMRREVK